MTDWAGDRGLVDAGFSDLLESLFVPLAGFIAARRRASGRAIVIGVSGAQGTGKSTLAELLALLLADGFGLRTACVSLDDFYRTRAEREQLAAGVHPLLRTRGVPGTHDVELGARTLSALRALGAGQRVRVPRFDKAKDDRAPEREWSEVEGPIDAVLFEGWCVGARPQSEAALRAPINALEREHDADGRFRRHADAQLAGAYRALEGALDLLVFLAAPDLQSSLRWRIEQEHALAARTATAGGDRALMSDAQVVGFVQHYERISRHMLAELPGRADVVLRLDREHRYAGVEVR